MRMVYRQPKHIEQTKEDKVHFWPKHKQEHSHIPTCLQTSIIGKYFSISAEFTVFIIPYVWNPQSSTPWEMDCSTVIRFREYKTSKTYCEAKLHLSCFPELTCTRKQYMKVCDRLLVGHQHNFFFMRQIAEPYENSLLFSHYLKHSYRSFVEGTEFTKTSLQKALKTKALHLTSHLKYCKESVAWWCTVTRHTKDTITEKVIASNQDWSSFNCGRHLP